jgi:hypothetical protein
MCLSCQDDYKLNTHLQYSPDIWFAAVTAPWNSAANTYTMILYESPELLVGPLISSLTRRSWNARQTPTARFGIAEPIKSASPTVLTANELQAPCRGSMSWLHTLAASSSPNTPCVRWVNTGWVVGEFVDITKIWVNLFHFCWWWVKFDIFTRFLFQMCRFHPLFFHPLLFPASPTCRFHLLVDFVFTHFFFPFHPLADFTYLLISPTFRFHSVSTDNSEATLTCGLGWILALVHRPHCCRFH